MSQNLEEKIKEFNEIVESFNKEVSSFASPKGWKFHQGDATGAENSKFDDSDWQVVDPGHIWPAAEDIHWLRKEIVIPEKLAGMPLKGSKVTLHITINQGGKVYINGDLKAEFPSWIDMSTVLSEETEPKERFLVAVKAFKKPGMGWFTHAYLGLDAIENLSLDVNSFLEEIKFSQKLSEFHPEKREEISKLLLRALDSVKLDSLKAGDVEGVTKSLKEARRILSPLSPDAKTYTCHLVGHAHIDMNWLWSWPETVKICKDTFGTMVRFLEEYPELCFSQSQAPPYIAVEETELFDKIKFYVKEGGWEVTGGTWVEGDLNMASGESLVRQILYAKLYFKNRFGVEPKICWSPDAFGHPWTIPQILKKSGIDYYFFMRCGKDAPLFWWESQDGSRVLAFNRAYYGAITPSIASEPLAMKEKYGIKDCMIVYGVCDHGGGPTRRDIKMAKELANKTVFPRVEFSTAHRFFERALLQTKSLPVVKDELNFIFEGCYTTHGDIKKMNRICENLLPTAEAFSAIAILHGLRYPEEDFLKAWRNTCFNQFHDLLCGTAIHEAYDYSRELFKEVYEIGRRTLEKALKTIAAQVNTKGQGMPVIVFNPSAWERTDVTEVELPFDVQPIDVDVYDADGKFVPAQILKKERRGEKNYVTVAFLARKLPSIGYKVYFVSPSEKLRTYPKAVVVDASYKLENQFFFVQIDVKSGCLTSVFDKLMEREVIAPGAKGNVLQVLFEKPHFASAWIIGPIEREEELTSPKSVEIIEKGPVRAVVRILHKYKKSSFQQDVILYHSLPRIDFTIVADWNEQGTSKEDAPMLKVAFPVSISQGKAFFEIPFGSIKRPADGHEVPALKWIDLSEEDYGVSLLNDCKYGHDVKGNRIRLTLLRSSYEPDPNPDRGRHRIIYSLYPHEKTWKEADTVRRASELNNQLIAVAEEAHFGSLPKIHSFLSVKPKNIVLSALKKAEGSDDLLVRFYESQGKDVEGQVKMGFHVSSAQETNLLEKDIGGKIALQDDGTLKLPVGKNEIKTVRFSV